MRPDEETPETIDVNGAATDGLLATPTGERCPICGKPRRWDLKARELDALLGGAPPLTSDERVETCRQSATYCRLIQRFGADGARRVSERCTRELFPSLFGGDADAAR